jgi:hypothetical protein
MRGPRRDVVGRVACRTSRSLKSGQLSSGAGDHRRTVEQSLPQSPHLHGRQLTSTHILLGLLTICNHSARILDRRRKLGDPTIREKLYHICECCISDFLVFRKKSAGSCERELETYRYARAVFRVGGRDRREACAGPWPLVLCVCWR